MKAPLLLTILLVQLTNLCLAASDRVIACLVMEAGGEPWDGKVAVMSVIRNRALKQGKSFEAIVEAPRQFSCMSWDVVAKAKDKRHIGAWNDCRRIVEMAEKWVLPDTSKGATHYCTLTCHPPWSYKLKETVVIGRHRFFE